MSSVGERDSCELGRESSIYTVSLLLDIVASLLFFGVSHETSKRNHRVKSTSVAKPAEDEGKKKKSNALGGFGIKIKCLVFVSKRWLIPSLYNIEDTCV